MQIKKIFLAALAWGTIIGLLCTETIVIFNHEIERQANAASTACANIVTDLNMIKIAAQTNDVDMFVQNINDAENQLQIFTNLPIVASDYAGFAEEVSAYLVSAASKTDLIIENYRLKQIVESVDSKLKDLYSNKKITTDALKAAPTQIRALKLEPKDFSFPENAKIASAVNSALDTLAERASELSKCVDKCYKSSFTSAASGLKKSLQTFDSQLAALNQTIDQDFNFLTF